MKIKIPHALTLIATCAFVLGTAKIAVCQSSQQYRTLPQSTQKPPKGKIEVIEFFMYSSPVSLGLEPQVNSWVKNLPKDVIFRRLAVALSAVYEQQARLFFALETMGLLDKLHPKVCFAVTQKQLSLLGDQETFADWVSSQGVDRAKFLQVYNSFSVTTRVKQARQLFDRSQLDTVPIFLINGQFIARQMGNDPQGTKLFNVLNELIVKARTTVSADSSPKATSKSVLQTVTKW